MAAWRPTISWRRSLAAAAALTYLAISAPLASGVEITPRYQAPEGRTVAGATSVSSDGSRLIVGTLATGSQVDAAPAYRSIDLSSGAEVALPGWYVGQSADGRRVVMSRVNTFDGLVPLQLTVSEIEGAEVRTRRVLPPLTAPYQRLQTSRSGFQLGVGADGTIWLATSGYGGEYHGAIFRVRPGQQRFELVPDPTFRTGAWGNVAGAEDAAASAGWIGPERASWGYCKWWPERSPYMVSMTIVDTAPRPTYRTITRRGRGGRCLQSSASDASVMTYVSGGTASNPRLTAAIFRTTGAIKTISVGSYGVPVAISPSGRTIVLTRSTNDRPYLVLNTSTRRSRVVNRAWPERGSGVWSTDERLVREGGALRDGDPNAVFLDVLTGRVASVPAVSRLRYAPEPCFYAARGLFVSDGDSLPGATTTMGSSVLIDLWRPLFPAGDVSEQICAPNTAGLRPRFTAIHDNRVYVSSGAFDGTIQLPGPA